MLNAWSLVLVSLGYMLLLFLIAWTGDRRRLGPSHRVLRSVIYSLSLGVYCTSWTFYGAVGSAATAGWGFLAIYLGPALVFLFGIELLQRIATISHEHRITSIADFIAWRYDRSHAIAVLVTVAAVLGSLPYVALQLKGIVTGFEVISEASGTRDQLSAELPLYVALFLALFSMLFGTRNMDAHEHHRGLMWAIAFESVVKLLAFAAIGGFVLFGIFGGLGEFANAVRSGDQLRELFSPWRIPEGFGVQLVLAMAAIICLPRQFHVGIVEYRSPADLRLARWMFPAYLAAFAGLVVPIAAAGLSRFGSGTINPDSYVLALPLAFGQDGLAVLAFLGGFSAASGMVIVATVALAIMVSNDIVMPMLLRSGLGKGRGQTDLSRLILRVRRVSMLSVTLLGYLYFRAIEAGVPLASIGLLSFSAAAQFAPAMLIGLYWPRANRQGALAGLTVGMTAWLVLLLLPSLSGTLEKPAYLPGMDFNSGASWALLLNAFFVVAGSLLLPRRSAPGGATAPDRADTGLITLGELQQTIGRFLGAPNTQAALATHLGVTHLEPSALATPATVQFGERLLAGSIGLASARTVLATALHHRGLGPDAVLELLDQTSQAVQFNRELLESTLDNLAQGVAVIDSELRLVGWNRRYLELMQYPEGTVYLGQHIEELMRFNARRGLLGDGDTSAEIRKRLDHLRESLPYRYERSWLNGAVLEIEGNPMPGGGYVTTYSDISRFKQIERKLQEINETLEQRVLQRTRELSDAFSEVEQARERAEAADLSKTRFLAAASHDLLQPMNAARLFLSVLGQQHEGGEEQAKLIMRVDRSLGAAEELLSALLDISKFDSGMYHPEPEAIEVAELFEQLRRRFKPLAANRDLPLRVWPSGCVVYSDRRLLYRILQNFLANAIRYTETGGVLLGCRRQGSAARLCVWDTGVGIDENEREAIFQEFHRLDYAQRLEERGLGLGLAICDRIAKTLGHPIHVASRPGHGSCFSVLVPLASPEAVTARLIPETAPIDFAPLRNLNVLCIDNEPEILDGMRLLLERWGCAVQLARDPAGAEAAVASNAAPELVLVDYHLDDRANGIDVIDRLFERIDARPPVVVITADRSAELEQAVKARGFALLAKPIKPAALRSLITHLLKPS